MSFEHRSVDLVDADLKGRMFRGLAAVYDTPWNEKLIEATGYIEKVARGAFRKALSGSDDVPLLLAHDRHQLLGTTGSGNVRLKDDAKGLVTEAQLPDNYLGEYARSMIEAGDLKGMSYGIELDPRRDTMLTKENGIYTRTVVAAKRLLDVSLTYEPAYAATTVELRSTGFVATPLQELLGGEEAQPDAGGNGDTPPDEQAAWWGEENAPDPEPAQDDGQRPAWSVYLDELEREV